MWRDAGELSYASFGLNNPHCVQKNLALHTSSPARLGWVIFDPLCADVFGFTMCLPHSVLETFSIRKTQIYACEAFAPLAALWNSPGKFRGRDVIAFVDNEAACAALVRGSASCPDVESICQTLHLTCAYLGCRWWVEWIDSDSNPSDGLSRAGLKDAWTVAQSWTLAEAAVPPWESCQQDILLWLGTLGPIY